MKPAPRTRASLACQSCRRRKVKCDAQKISADVKCKPCQQMNLPCTVDRDGDRRKAGSRRHVETLEQRIMDLESLLRRTVHNRQQSEPASWEGDEPRSEDRVPSPSGPQLDASAAAPPPYALPLSTVDLNLAESFPTLENVGTGTLQDAEPCSSHEDRSSGQGFRALGPTSRYHARSPGKIQPNNHPHRHRSCAKTNELADLGVAINTNTSQVKCRLFQSFFRYQPLWVNAVDEELFWEHRENSEPSIWYSSFLEAVMLASASRLSNSSAVRSLGEQYAIQAKAEILQALANPSPASAQGFLMLSEYEVSQGRELMGWQLCGMACRLLTDLGLHESPNTSVDAESTHLQEVRLHLLGACITLEGVWCMYLGRPSSIPRPVLDTAALSGERYQGPDSATLTTWLGLCGPMADICKVLNGSRPLNPQAKACLSQLSNDLHSWLEKLPAGFVYDGPNAADLDPAAYAVHMQFCKIQILVEQASSGGDELVKTHRVRIYEAAIRIIRLLLIYRQIHGTERIRSVMLDNVNIALAALVGQYLQHPELIETHKRDIQWLRLAIENMVDIQPHFPIIGRMLNSLAVATEGTQLAPLFRAMQPYSSPGCSSTLAESFATPDVIRAEQLPVESSADDLDQISRSLTCGSNPPLESFWDPTAGSLTIDPAGL